jgi:hypothetical protein
MERSFEPSGIVGGVYGVAAAAHAGSVQSSCRISILDGVAEIGVRVPAPIGTAPNGRLIARLDRMMHSWKLAIGIQLAAIAAFAQSQPHTYVGDVVKANCLQAAEIVSRNSRGYVPPGVNAFTRSRYENLHTARLRSAILRHCSINPGATAFALLTDDGNFFRLDETGNFEVLSHTTGMAKKVRVTVTGFVDRETLNVQTLSKF